MRGAWECLKLTVFRAALLGVCLALLGCSKGTRGRNPIEPVQVAIRLGGATDTSLTRLAFCLSELSFVPYDGSTPVGISITKATVEVMASSQALTTVSLPPGTYGQIVSKLSADCTSGKTVELDNTNGSFATADLVSVRFLGAFTTDSTTLTLDLLPIAVALKQISGSAAIGTTLDTRSGNILSTTPGGGGSSGGSGSSGSGSSGPSTYVSEVLTDLPFEYYRFEDTVSTGVGFDNPMTDSSGLGRSGVWTGPAPANRQPGAPLSISNFSILFGETDPTLGSPNDSGHWWKRDNGTVDLPTSFEAWVHPSPGGSGMSQAIVALSDPAQTSYFFGLDTNDLLFMVFYKFNGTAQIGRSSSSLILSDGAWHHVVATYDGSATDAGIKLYIDGNPVATSSMSFGVYSGMQSPAGRTPTIGAVTDGTSVFRGFIDEVAAYDHVLTPARVAAHFTNK